MTARKNARIEKSPFGDRFEFDVPEGAYAVVVCENRGGGWRPLKFLLPHQVYVKDYEADVQLVAFPITTPPIKLRAGKKFYSGLS